MYEVRIALNFNPSDLHELGLLQRYDHVRAALAHCLDEFEISKGDRFYVIDAVVVSHDVGLTEFLETDWGGDCLDEYKMKHELASGTMSIISAAPSYDDAKLRGMIKSPTSRWTPPVGKFPMYGWYDGRLRLPDLEIMPQIRTCVDGPTAGKFNLPFLY
jgi:hypothetical protein